MGFLPNLFKIPKHDLIPNIITVGQYGLVKGSLKEGIRVGVPALRNLFQAIQLPHQAAQLSPEQTFAQGYPQQPIYQSAPYYGGSQWDYSTQSPIFSALPPSFQGEVYSATSLGFSQDQWPEGFSR